MFVVWSCLLLGVIVGLLGSGFVAGLFWVLDVGGGWLWVCAILRFVLWVFVWWFCGCLCVGCYVVVGLLDCS